MTSDERERLAALAKEMLAHYALIAGNLPDGECIRVSVADLRVMHRALLTSPAAREEREDGERKLAAFGAWAVEEFRSDFCNIDGATARDKMVELGIIAPVRMTAACGECCRCVDYDDFPQECLRYASDVQAYLATRSPSPSAGTDTRGEG